jgi:hypothetical protein
MAQDFVLPSGYVEPNWAWSCFTNSAAATAMRSSKEVVCFTRRRCMTILHCRDKPDKTPGSVIETQRWQHRVPWLELGRLKMAIYRLLQNSPFGPVEIAVLTDAYERTLQKLSLVDRNDPLTELIAKKVIELGQRGVRDAGQLSGLAIKELGLD